MPHRVDMLGTGNAFLPHGRHHSFAMIDGKHIIDAPPTALAGLRRLAHDVASIETVFVTHVHGDHVFGFPFLLLERKYISDRDGVKPLRVVGTPFVKERLSTLCQMAFPGSLESMLEAIEWDMRDVGTTDDGWSWERFEVHHDDAVEPHGYRFEHESGASFVHSGDSGPCDALYEALEKVRQRDGLFFSALLVTDINTQNSLLLIRGEDIVIDNITYPHQATHDIFELNGVVSRKKQLIPYLTTLVRQLAPDNVN